MVVCLIAALPIVACQKDDPNQIKIIASYSPHAEILRQADTLLRQKGYSLKIQKADTYEVMNKNTANGEFDANYFQHEGYLENDKAQNGYDLGILTKVHYEPMGIYRAKQYNDNIDNLTASDKIAIPDDTTNMQRALELLVVNNILQYNSGDKSQLSSYSGVGNFNVDNIKTLPADMVSQTINDNYALAVINGNYALDFYNNAETAKQNRIVSEPAELGQTYANLVAVRTADIESPKMQALKEVLQGEQIAEFIANTYSGLVMPLQ